MNYDEAKSFMDNLSGRQIAETILQGIGVPPLSVDALADIIERYANHRVEDERHKLLDLFSKRMGMSVASLLEYLPELQDTHDSTSTKGTTA